MLSRAQQIAQESDESVKAYLTSDKKLDRAAAAYVVGEKKLALREELITMLGDSDKQVQQMARRSLILLANFAVADKGEPGKTTASRVRDLIKIGPSSRAHWDVDAASKKWRTWWDQNDPNQERLKSAVLSVTGSSSEK